MLKKLIAIAVAAVVLIIAVAVFYVWRHPLAVAAAAERRTLKSAGFQRKSVAGPKGTLVYWEKGNGDVVLMLHGAGDQAGTWSQVAPRMAEHHRVILPDLAGHGESAPAAGPLTIGDAVNGLDALMASQNLGRVTLVGNSMGGWVGLLYAYEHPERVERVVVVNGGPYAVNTTYNLTPGDREEARGVMARIQDSGSPRIPGFILDDIVRKSHSGPIGRLKQASQQEFTLDGKLGSMRVPVAIIWGEADQMLTKAYAERLRSDISGAQVTYLSRCGHIPQRECPVAFGGALSNVLELPRLHPGASAVTSK